MEQLFPIPLVSRMESLDERTWLPAARRGEQWALERFYHCHQAQVYALCRRILARPEDAEDAMQAAFVKAFRSLPTFRGDCAARTWIYRIAVNEAVQLIRTRENALPLLVDVPAPERSGVADQKLAVQAALARVQPKHRLVLILYYWEGLSYEEIAGVLQVPLPTVKMRLNRAREEFHRRYGEEP